MVLQSFFPYGVVTPLRKAVSYEPRIAILWIWGDTWLTRGKYGIYMAVRGSYGALTWSTWRLLEILPRKISTFYCRVSYVTVTRITSLVLCNMWHYVIIQGRKFWFPKFVLRCSYEAALRKGVTTALKVNFVLSSLMKLWAFCQHSINIKALEKGDINSRYHKYVVPSKVGQFCPKTIYACAEWILLWYVRQTHSGFYKHYTQMSAKCLILQKKGHVSWMCFIN